MNRILIFALAMLANSAAAQNLNIPNSFQAGTPARAVEVNQNFDAVATAVNDNIVDIEALLERVNSLEAQLAAVGALEERVAQLEAAQTTVEDHESRISQVESNTVLELDGYLAFDPDASGQGEARPEAVFTGVNLRVRNGTGLSEYSNGLGNIIIGYMRYREWAYSIFSEPICSLGTLINRDDCVANGEVWSEEHDSGSHNLIIGDGHRYSQHSSVIVGSHNTSLNAFTAVFGLDNSALGAQAHVFGGWRNTASGSRSAVLGGRGNRAQGIAATVSGGLSNGASGENSSIAGGWGNSALGPYSSVSGGLRNEASATASTVSGGAYHVADMENEHVP